MNPLVSVIIPAYNSEKYISEAVESVINQTYKNIELIIVNDGSTDKTLDIVNEFSKKDSRVVIVNKENGGVSSARNLGFEIAKGDYIALLDSDDVCSEDRIEKQVHEMNDKSLDVCSGAMTTFGNTKKNKLYVYPESDSELKFNLLFFGKTIPCSPAMLTKSIIKSYKFRTDMDWAEDYAYWLNLLLEKKENVQFGNISSSLIGNRIHDEQTTQRLKDKNRKVIVTAVYDGLLKAKVDLSENEVYMHYDVIKCAKTLDENEMNLYLKFLDKLYNLLRNTCECQKYFLIFYKKLIIKQSKLRHLIIGHLSKKYGYSLSLNEKMQIEISIMKNHLKRVRL